MDSEAEGSRNNERVYRHNLSPDRGSHSRSDGDLYHSGAARARSGQGDESNLHLSLYSRLYGCAGGYVRIPVDPADEAGQHYEWMHGYDLLRIGTDYSRRHGDIHHARDVQSVSARRDAGEFADRPGGAGARDVGHVYCYRGEYEFCAGSTMLSPIP